MITLEQIIPHLKDPVPDGKGGYMSFCPAHLDGKKQGRRSLHIEEKNGKLLVYCFAGCSYENIMQALGFDHPFGTGNRQQREPEAVYDYLNETGRLLYQVLRFPGKQFKQRRPDGAGAWIYNLKGVERTLYRLPETLAAVKRGETIYIPEGEKDCENLVKLGLAATANSGGAGKWEPRFTDYLIGASVVILPDNDEPGRKHVDQVARSLQGKAKSIKVVELPDLPEKSDVSDWLSAGGTREKLLEIADKAQTWGKKPSQKTFMPLVTCLADVEPEELSWLWQPYIPLSKLTLLEGDPGIGKTWAALQIAATISRGDPFPDSGDGTPRKRREPARVVYLSAEDGLGDTLRPRLDAVEADVKNVYALIGRSHIDEETGEERQEGVTLQDVNILRQVLDELKPRMVVVDPLQAYLGASVDMHRANEVRPVLSGLAKLAEEYKCAVLLIRHLAKGQKDRAVYRGLGSVDFAAAARSMLLAGQDPRNPQNRAIIQTKSSLAEIGPSIGYELQSGKFYWTGISNLTAENVLAPAPTDEEKSAIDEAVEFLKDVLADGPVAAKEIEKQRKASGCVSERTLLRAKKELNVESFKNGNCWYWTLDRSTPESPIKYVGSLGNVPETLAAQGIEEDFQGCHVATLNEGLEPLQHKGQSQVCQDCQDNMLDPLTEVRI